MKSRQGSVALIVLIIVVVLLVAAGAYYLGTRNMTPAAQNVGSGQPVSTTSSNEYAGWEIYANSAHSFQLKYPPVFTDPPTESTQGSYLTVSFYADTPTSTNSSIGGESLLISVSPRGASETLESDIQNYEKSNVAGGATDCSTQMQVATTTVQGEEAANIDCSEALSSFGEQGTIGSMEELILFHNNMEFVIGLVGDASGNDTFAKIIQSVVFTR